MATNNKKIGIYAITGVLAAIVIIAAIFASGIEFLNFRPSGKTGTLSVSIMDAPADLVNLNVTLNALYVHNDDNDSWIQLNFNDGANNFYFNSCIKQHYERIIHRAFFSGKLLKNRLDVSAANATLNDGTTENLRVPPGHIDVIVSFQVKADQTTNVLLDMQVDTADISYSGNLKPVLKATIQYIS